MTRKTIGAGRAVLRTLATASGAALTSAAPSRQAAAASDAAMPQKAAMNKIKGHATTGPAHGAQLTDRVGSAVIRPLQSMGLPVIAALLLLTSFMDDVDALNRTVERTEGPVVLVAHAYAGAVISACASERVKSLVFIAALAPDEGETVGDVFYRAPAHPDTAKLAPDANGLLWMAEGDFGKAFAQHGAPAETHLLYATQRPINVVCIKQKVPKPGWKTRPSLVPDRRARPDDQFPNAALHGEPDEGPHHVAAGRPSVPLITSPDDVVKIIRQSVEAAGLNVDGASSRFARTIICKAAMEIIRGHAWRNWDDFDGLLSSIRKAIIGCRGEIRTRPGEKYSISTTTCICAVGGKSARMDALVHRRTSRRDVGTV